MTHSGIDEAELVSGTTRLCQRYIDEVVLPYSLCPWAAPALAGGKVQILVITDVIAHSTSFIAAAQRVLSVLRDEVKTETELALIVLPRCEYSRLQMDDLLRAVRQKQRPVGTLKTNEAPNDSEVSFALAAFHPDAAPDTSTPERLIPYLRRTPEPMIQAVRTDTLAKIDPDRGAGTAYFDLESLDLEKLSRPAPEPLRLRIARANLETCQARGLAELEACFRSILEDRDQTRAKRRS
jgi:hypothetical protein